MRLSMGHSLYRIQRGSDRQAAGEEAEKETEDRKEDRVRHRDGRHGSSS